MTEQFLQRAKVRATRQKVGRETMPQRVRGQRVRQTEPAPRRSDGPPEMVRVQRTGARPDELRV
jgi:hypothetical protein